jgi:RNA polymerase sigma factor (TIGR02999 family)
MLQAHPNTAAAMTLPAYADVTAWLRELDQGASGASNELFGILYTELHRIARSHMAREFSAHTLSATALTHEAWFRMAEQTRTRWVNRSQFLSVASTMMRRILVNHAAAKRAEKRDGQLVSLSLTEAQALASDTPVDVVAVHEAILAFEAIDPRAAKIVELRFFGGLENEEIAQALGISLATVKRDWSAARAWLRRELGASPAA